MMTSIADLREHVNELHRRLDDLSKFYFAFFVDAQPADTIRCRRFELVDDDGVPVIVLAALERGGAVRVLNRAGRPVAMIDVSDAGGVVGVAGDDGEPVASIEHDGQGGALKIIDAEGRTHTLALGEPANE